MKPLSDHTIFAVVCGIVIGALGMFAFSRLAPQAPSLKPQEGIVVTNADGSSYTLPSDVGVWEWDGSSGMTRGGSAFSRGGQRATGQGIEAQGDEGLANGESQMPAFNFGGLFSGSGLSASVSTFVTEFAGSGGAWLLFALGAVFIAGGPALIIASRKYALGVSMIEAALVSASGVLIVLLGFAGKDLAGPLLLCAFVPIAGFVVIRIVQSERTGHRVGVLNHAATKFDELATKYWTRIASSSDAGLAAAIEADIAGDPDLVLAHNDLLKFKK